MKVAVVYDRVNKWGGAERVLLAFHKIFPEADLFTSVYNTEKAAWAKVFNVKTSFLQDFPLAKSLHQLYAVLMPIAFESFNFDGYDLVISVTSESAKGIITKPETLHICYCLTPNRYLWSGYDDYFKNPLLRFISKPVVSYLKMWDKASSQRPDKFIAISTAVKDRIKKYYGRDSVIIYPPLQISDIGYQISGEKKAGDYFLIVSRLEWISYKKIDIAIKACNKLKLPLKIVGIGTGEKKLRKLAGPTVEFLGQLTDEKLSYYYKNCRALIFPGLEDFGLVMVEAQNFGKPVIAFRGGGALDIVKEGITGEFFDRQTPEALEKVLVKFKDSSYNSKLCKENTQRFSFERFEDDLKRFIDKNL
ncbi:MAG: glycosyltransferase [Patescibacteria group bacterium]|nr:glycosyltransferase [Patescibacteria group bacterium]